MLVLERDDGTSAPRLGRPARHAAARRPHLQLAVLNACEGARTSGPRRLLRGRPGARAPGPARRRRDADGDLRPGGARLQPRVLLVPHARARHRRRHLRGAQGDGGLGRGLRVGHRGAAAVRAPTSPSPSRRAGPAGRPRRRAGSSPSTTPRRAPSARARRRRRSRCSSRSPRRAPTSATPRSCSSAYGPRPRTALRRSQFRSSPTPCRSRTRGSEKRRHLPIQRRLTRQ